jgi:PST family polysaccharide transporter
MDSMAERFRYLVRRATREPILRDSSIILLSNCLRKGISLVQSIILFRALGAQNYGLIIFVISLVSFIIQFLDVRTTDAVIKFMGSAISRQKPAEAITFFKLGLGTHVCVATGILILILAIVPALAELSSLLIIYAFAVPLITLQNTFISVLLTFRRFRLFAALSLVADFILLVWVILLSPYGVTAVMLGYWLTAVMVFGLWTGSGLFLLRKNFSSFQGESYRSAWRQFYPFMLHTSLSASCKTIFSYVGPLSLGIFQTPDTLFYYQIATSAAELVLFAIHPIRLIIFPALNMAWATRQMTRVHELLRLFIAYILVIEIGALMFFLVNAHWLVHLLYGARAFPAVPILYILVLADAMSNMFSWIRPLAMASGKPQLLTISTVVQSLLRATLIIPLVRGYGLMGLAVAMLIANALSALFNWFSIVPKLELRRELSGISSS